MRYPELQTHLTKDIGNLNIGHFLKVCGNSVYSANLIVTASAKTSFAEFSESSKFHLLNGGLPWSMSVPTTPTKQGEDINRLLRSLNTEWGLRLPVRDKPISPSKIPRRDRRGERIYQKIRYLSFKNPEALQVACAQFETHAKQQESLWVYKPHAETDILPSRPAAEFLLRKKAYSRFNEVSEVDRDALEETLLRFLDEAVKGRSLFTSRRLEPNDGMSVNIYAGLLPSILRKTFRTEQCGNGRRSSGRKFGVSSVWVRLGTISQ